MVDVSDVIDRLPPRLLIGQAHGALIRWVPGLREDAPKRNLILLIAYIELLLFGLPLLRYFV